MSKKFIGGLFLGLAVPVVAGGVCLGTPSIRNKIFKQNNNSTSLESRIDDLTKENAGLQQDNVTLEGRINTLESNLATANATIQSKDTAIAEKNTQIAKLESEKQAIADELEQTKALLGDDVNYAELVVSLQTQLTDKKNELATVTAERDQLLLDKTALETQVSELTTELNQVKEELSNYKSLGEIDKLKVSNFDGTWYKNGTFEDYYTISNGVVTRGADTDKGLLNNIYNQMYLMMNTTGGEAVTLSDDGSYFTTADGVKYSKFYINTVTSVVPTYSFAGEYTYNTTVVKLNADNTCAITIDGTLYHGAYTVTSKEKNVGGNITRYNSITSTYQINDTAVVKEYTHTTNNMNALVNTTDNYSMEKTKGIDATLFVANNFTVDSLSGKNYVELVVKTPNITKYSDGAAVTVRGVGPMGTSSMYCTINGYQVYNEKANNKCYIKTSSAVNTNVYKFYLYSFSYNGNVQLSSLSIDMMDVDILDMNVVGFSDSDIRKFFTGNLLDFYNLKYNSEVMTTTCNPVSDYTVGTYTNDDMTVSLTSDTATIGDVTATSMTTSATTDGTDIYQTVTIKYTVESTTHTLIMNFKNNTLLTSKLDNTDVVLTK